MEAPKTQKVEKGDKTNKPQTYKAQKVILFTRPSPNCICASAASEAECSDAAAESYCPR